MRFSYKIKNALDCKIKTENASKSVIRIQNNDFISGYQKKTKTHEPCLGPFER